MTRILSLIAFGLSIGLLISVRALSSEVAELKKPTATEIGLLRGELHSYKVTNAEAWKAQVEVNDKVLHVLEVLNNVDA